MIIKHDQPLSRISWLTTLNGEGCVSNYYEPETLQELKELCTGLYSAGSGFDLIGHTSNTLYSPDYKCENMVSTRKLNHFEILPDSVVCECGTSVRQLSLAAIEEGIKGFEGLTDLPGTVAAALYGNAGCFDCSISSLLLEAEILMPDGNVISAGPEWFGFAKRSSALKRREKCGVTLSVRLRRESASAEALKAVAEENHSTRRATQPEAKDSLGSIFAASGKPSLLNKTISALTKVYGLVLKVFGCDEQKIAEKRRHLTFAILGARDVEPYVRTWNWYQWRDGKAHALFGKYVRLHKLMFTCNEFEIERKQNDR